jgi:hypothetical protein
MNEMNEEDAALVSKLAGMTATELLAAVAAAAGERTAQEKKEVAAQAVRAYIAKGNSLADYGGCALNEAALELDRQRQDKEQTDD